MNREADARMQESLEEIQKLKENNKRLEARAVELEHENSALRLQAASADEHVAEEARLHQQVVNLSAELERLQGVRENKVR